MASRSIHKKTNMGNLPGDISIQGKDRLLKTSKVFSKIVKRKAEKRFRRAKDRWKEEY